jgi:hypothetical protein
MGRHRLALGGGEGGLDAVVSFTMTEMTGFVCAMAGAPKATPATMAAVIINVFILILP